MKTNTKNKAFLNNPSENIDIIIEILAKNQNLKIEKLAPITVPDFKQLLSRLSTTSRIPATHKIPGLCAFILLFEQEEAWKHFLNTHVSYSYYTSGFYSVSTFDLILTFDSSKFTNLLRILTLGSQVSYFALNSQDTHALNLTYTVRNLVNSNLTDAFDSFVLKTFFWFNPKCFSPLRQNINAGFFAEVIFSLCSIVYKPSLSQDLAFIFDFETPYLNNEIAKFINLKLLQSTPEFPLLNLGLVKLVLALPQYASIAVRHNYAHCIPYCDVETLLRNHPERFLD